jgi:hypothetical protein
VEVVVSGAVLGSSRTSVLADSAATRVAPLPKFLPAVRYETDMGIALEVFYGTQYHPTVVRWYCQFFQFFTMGKMVIARCILFGKNFPDAKVTQKDLISYITTILFCIFPIIPMYYPYDL